MIGQKSLKVGADAGGVEKHVDELSARLVKQGVAVTAYVRKRHSPTDRVTEGGVHVVGVRSVATKHLDAITYTFLATLAAMRSSAKVIHYHGVGPATLAWIPRLFAPSKKVVVTFHSIDRHHQKWGLFARWYLHFGEWAALYFPHRTVAVSLSIQKYCKQTYGMEPEYVPNGAPIPAYPGSDLLAQFGLSKDGYVLTVARLVRQKGIHHLIAAYDGFEGEKKLVVVGASAFGSEYADYVRQLSEGNSSIIFTGFQTGPALAQLFANAYLYVHPSEAEGLAISILEAMANGRCVLVSDIPENMESIDHSGLSFATTDVDDLRVKIRELLNHPEVVAELGEKARRWIKLAYDWDDISMKIAGVYRSLLRKPE